MSSDPIATCELLVGLGDVTVLDVADVDDRSRVTGRDPNIAAVVPEV